MPTIDELPAAVTTTDTDELMLSQGGSAAKATRAQLTAGLQSQIVLASGQILGRTSTGVGGPEPIAIGGNLVLQGGILSAAAPLVIAGLPAGRGPAATDLVPIGQGGTSATLSYSDFVAGLSGLSGIDGSALAVKLVGATTPRTLSGRLGDWVTPEDFGAAGDGTTDDSAAMAAAVATGRPVWLGPRTYIVNGQWTITSPNVKLMGTAGVSTLRRGTQAGNGAWISVQAEGFLADGVIFDANRAAVQTDSWGVLVAAACLQSSFRACAFLNAAGATLGSGLVFESSDPAPCQHLVADCEFSENNVHGLWIQACADVTVMQCRAYNNGQHGLVADFSDPTFVQKVRRVRISGNRCWNNQRGISVGNFNATNLSPPTWGNANPDSISPVVSGNICHDNSIYGIAMSGWGCQVEGNVCTDNGIGIVDGAGILANMSASRVCGNMVSGTMTFGIDCGGATALDVQGNLVSGAEIGINCGGGIDVNVAGNSIQECPGWAVVAQNIETDGAGNNFGVASTRLAVVGNRVLQPTTTAGGIWLRDGPQGVLVADNSFSGPGNASMCLWGGTDSLTVRGNLFNGNLTIDVVPTVHGLIQRVLFPDIVDGIVISSAPAGVQSVVSSYQAQMEGQITFVRITAGGQNYTRATITIGGPGSGATAVAVIAGGVVIGATIQTAGSGYGAIGDAVTATISGDGSGAAAVAYAAPPLIDGRSILVRCATAIRFSGTGSSPLQYNWTGADIDVPAESDIQWRAKGGGWWAGPFPPADYLATDQMGGAILRSQPGGDVMVHPGGTGRLRLLADGEATGCVSLIGRGSPQGLIDAPPGSDYRNLDGGAGATYWIKQSGTAAVGWIAVV